nr:hypothetical protein [Tanacetum cinerariifolium]
LSFVLDCVLSCTAFCLGLRFAQLKTFSLRFAKDKLCQNHNCVVFCLRILRFVFKKNLAFCLRSIAICLKSRILRFVSAALRFA